MAEERNRVARVAAGSSAAHSALPIEPGAKTGLYFIPKEANTGTARGVPAQREPECDMTEWEIVKLFWSDGTNKRFFAKCDRTHPRSYHAESEWLVYQLLRKHTECLAYLPEVHFGHFSDCGRTNVLLVEEIPGQLTAAELIPDEHHLMQQAFDAVLAFHNAGVHHLDIKPNHLRVRCDGASKCIVFIDFDLAETIESPYWRDTSVLHIAEGMAKRAVAKALNESKEATQHRDNLAIMEHYHPRRSPFGFTGCYCYASIAHHLGSTSPCWVDVQSLCFVLIDILDDAALPWVRLDDSGAKVLLTYKDNNGPDVTESEQIVRDVKETLGFTGCVPAQIHAEITNAQVAITIRGPVAHANANALVRAVHERTARGDFLCNASGVWVSFGDLVGFTREKVRFLFGNDTQPLSDPHLERLRCLARDCCLFDQVVNVCDESLKKKVLEQARYFIKSATIGARRVFDQFVEGEMAKRLIGIVNGKELVHVKNLVKEFSEGHTSSCWPVKEVPLVQMVPRTPKFSTGEPYRQHTENVEAGVRKHIAQCLGKNSTSPMCSQELGGIIEVDVVVPDVQFAEWDQLPRLTVFPFDSAGFPRTVIGEIAVIPAPLDEAAKDMENLRSKQEFTVRNKFIQLDRHIALLSVSSVSPVSSAAPASYASVASAASHYESLLFMWQSPVIAVLRLACAGVVAFGALEGQQCPDAEQVFVDNHLAVAHLALLASLGRLSVFRVSERDCPEIGNDLKNVQFRESIMQIAKVHAESIRVADEKVRIAEEAAEAAKKKADKMEKKAEKADERAKRIEAEADAAKKKLEAAKKKLEAAKKEADERANRAEAEKKEADAAEKEADERAKRAKAEKKEADKRAKKVQEKLMKELQELRAGQAESAPKDRAEASRTAKAHWWKFIAGVVATIVVLIAIVFALMVKQSIW